MTESPGDIFVQFTLAELLARASGLWRGYLCRWFLTLRLRRCERSYKCLFEVVNILEILNRIFFSFSENPGGDQIKNHMSNVLARMNAPAIEHRHYHRAEFFQRILPNAIEQFWTGYMAHADTSDLFLLLCRKIERIAQKNVTVPLIAGVVGHNRFESLSESNFLHGQKTRVSNALLK